MTLSDEQLSVWTLTKLQSTSQTKLALNKVMVTVWWSPADLSPCSFLNPGYPSYLKHVLGES